MRTIQPRMFQKAVCECGYSESEHDKNCYYGNGSSCNSYSPLRCKIKSVMSEDTWVRGLKFDFAEEKLTKDAKLEGFETWGQLQDALKTLYPKGVPQLARIEFVR